MDNGVFLAVF